MFCFGAWLLLFWVFLIIVQLQLNLNTNYNLVENPNQTKGNVALNNFYIY